jgi:vacuolar-type H+-ATPase subunit H
MLQKVASKSLAALQQRKQEIISQLEKVVGKSAASAISSSASSQARAVCTMVKEMKIINCS